MSAANARSNTFNETFLNDSYQDASTVSMELDKGANTNFIKKFILKIKKLFFRASIGAHWRTMRSNR